MVENNKTIELNDESLEKVNGGSNVAITRLTDLAIGDIVDITYSLTSGPHCLVSISEYKAYKFVQYIPNQYVDNAIRFAVIPDGLSMIKIGHDDHFALMNK